jgi:hypothetical protein
MASLRPGSATVRLTARVAAVPIGALLPRHTRRQRSSHALAAIIPGDGIIETTAVGGLYNL